MGYAGSRRVSMSFSEGKKKEENGVVVLHHFPFSHFFLFFLFFIIFYFFTTFISFSILRKTTISGSRSRSHGSASIPFCGIDVYGSNWQVFAILFFSLRAPPLSLRVWVADWVNPPCSFIFLIHIFPDQAAGSDGKDAHIASPHWRLWAAELTSRWCALCYALRLTRAVVPLMTVEDECGWSAITKPKLKIYII